MSRLTPDRNPKHSRHASGQGRVTLPVPGEKAGETHYTGIWGDDPDRPSPECLARYLDIIGRWNANGRRPLNPARDAGTVGGLCRAYAAHARRRFTKRGEPTSHALRCGDVADLVIARHDRTPLAEFTPKKLRDLRASWLAGGVKGSRCRSTVNQYARIVVEMFRWAVVEEIADPAAHMRLAALGSMDAGDAGTPDPPRRLSAPGGSVEACLARLSATPGSILRLMAISGMRPSEACSMRLADLDRSGEAWAYRVDPDYNKTEHHGRPRLVFLGPKAQAILAPHVEAAERRGGEGWIFTPSSGPRRGKGPYLAKTLRESVVAVLERHGLDHWSPSNLRHNALTAIHAAMGPKFAQAVGGHANASTTLCYIDPEASTAEEREAARRAAIELG